MRVSTFYVCSVSSLREKRNLLSSHKSRGIFTHTQKQEDIISEHRIAL